MENDINKLAHAWVLATKSGFGTAGYDHHFWAINELIDASTSNPEKVFKTILRILEIDTTDDVIQALGAGALEDIMVHHSAQYIERIETQAAISMPFKKVMQNVWLDADDSEYRLRFYEIAGISPPI